MYKDFIGWSLDCVGKGIVETKYLIEYINDEKTWNKFLKTEDLDLYSKREYDNIAEALEFYLTWFVNENCQDIKMWQQVFVNGEMVLEEFIEPKSTTKIHMRESINREMEKRMIQAERESSELKKKNNLYNGFIKRMGQQFEDLFYEYIRMETSKNEQ